MSLRCQSWTMMWFPLLWPRVQPPGVAPALPSSITLTTRKTPTSEWARRYLDCGMTCNVVMLVLQTYEICQSEVISPIVTSHGVYLVDFVCNEFGSYKVKVRVKSHKTNGETIVQKYTQVWRSRFWMCSMKVSQNLMNQGLKCLHTTDTRCITMHGIDCSVVKMNHMPLWLTDFQEFKWLKVACSYFMNLSVFTTCALLYL